MKYILVNTTANTFDNAIADGDYIISSVPAMPDYWERGEIQSLKGKYIVCNGDGYLTAVRNKNYHVITREELGLITDIQNLLPNPVFTVMGADAVFEGYLKRVSANG